MSDDFVMTGDSEWVRLKARNAELKIILARALADYESSICPEDMFFDWIEDARAALGEKKDG